MWSPGSGAAAEEEEMEEAEAEEAAAAQRRRTLCESADERRDARVAAETSILGGRTALMALVDL
jgi:hypothetical protein